MNKIICLFSFLILNISVQSQSFNGGFIPYPNTINVTQNNKICQLPFAGGIDVPQFSSIDLNFDGKKDLVIFDKEGGKITCLINKGNVGEIKYEYDATLSAFFPNDLTDWMLLVDYNGDGKEDIYSSVPGGVRVFKNTSTQANGISFELVNKDVQADYTSFISRLYSGPADLPAIVDVDDDGDIDILTMELGIDTAGDAIYWFKNLSMEKYAVKDSFDFVVYKRCWGRFRESFQNCNISLNYSSGVCGTGGKFIPDYNKEEFENSIKENLLKTNKHSGSTLLIFDSNGDNKKDILIGDIGCTNMYLLTNSTDNQNPLMSQFFQFYPSVNPAVLNSFPAAFLVDVNNDGKRDLIAAPNTTGDADNFANTYLYLNEGTESNPNFIYETNSFLEGEMIEIGEGANPCFVDYDQDGLQDIIISNTGYWQSSGVYKTGLAAYRNTGTLTQPAFELVNRDMWGLSTLNIANMAPSFGDMDKDGDLDMICGSNDGLLHYFENTAGPNQSFNLVFRSAYLTNIDLGNLSTPYLFDYNNDNKLEIISGERFDNVNLLIDTSSNNIPKYKIQTDSLAKINARNFVGYPSGRTTTLAKKLFPSDSFRLLVSNANGKVYVFSPLLLDPTVKNNIPVDSINLGAGIFTQSNGGFGISMADIDGDNKPELISGTPQGGLILFKNQTSAVGIENVKIENSSKIKCFPNPNSGKLTVQSESIIYQIEVIDQLGKTLQSVKSNALSIQIDLNEFQNGIYYLKVKTEEGIQFKIIYKQ